MFIGNESLDLKLTLMDSAQCFSWIKINNKYYAAVGNKAVCVWRDESGLFFEGDMTRAEMRKYLDLDRDYSVIANEYSHIPQACRAIQLYPGLRVLNQPTWDALLAFILSANNNVSRIRSLVHALCRAFGNELTINNQTVYAFPTPKVLANASEKELRSLGVGYRDAYLIKTANAVLNGFPLDALHEMDYPAALQLLTQLSGVGDKVANCVLLFGCGHASAFPVDVWVERLMQSWFNIGKLSRQKLCILAREKLGKNAGLLQQFLFHAARTGDLEL